MIKYIINIYHNEYLCDYLFMISAKNGKTIIVKYLYENHASEICQEYDALREAVWNGQIDTVKYMMGMFLGSNLFVDDNITINEMRFLANYNNHYELLEYFNSLSSDINI